MSSSNFSISLGGTQAAMDSSTSMPSSSREENCTHASVRPRTKANRMTSEAQNSQDFVHVVVRLKPLSSSNDSSTALWFTIDSGTLGTPRTGRRRNSSGHEKVTQLINNNNNNNNNKESARQDRVQNGMSSCASVKNTSVNSTTHVPGTQNGSPRAMPSPRLGVPGVGKILTISFPMPDAAKETVQHMYEFADVIGPSVTDEQMCNSMIPGILEQLKAGFNACILCYGQTGSGKTYTINSLIPAFISALFGALDAENDIVEMSYIQIYNNNVYNLLSEGKSDHGAMLQKPKGTVVREPLYVIRDAADAQSRIAEAQRKRFVCSHGLNARSSRSHALLSFHVTKCVEGIPVLKSRLTLGDLAGSERVKKTGVVGEELEEAIAINKSLSVLHAVIKATAYDAELLPVRESILTLYLASTLTDCYLLLIATVSMEKRDYAETKSSLDFAATAKRCVLTKRKNRPRDILLNGTLSFEEAYMHLMKEVETLRYRVSTLQEEVNIEKQRSAVMSKNDIMDNTRQNIDGKCNVENTSSFSSDAATKEGKDEDAKMRDHVLELERQCAVFQSILCDREKELVALESHGDVSEEVRQELQRQVKEKEEAQRTLEEVAPELETSELLRKVTDTIVWMQEQLDNLCQQKKFMTKAMEGMRSEQHRTMEDLLEARKRLVQIEKAQEATCQKMSIISAENTALNSRLEELQLKLLREYAERTIREETMSWFKASNERSEECEKMRIALEDQRNLCDVLQCRLSSTEQDLDRSNKQQEKLLHEMRKKDEAFRTIWLLLNPQQKARFMSFEYFGDSSNTPGSSSLHQGHENVQLRSQVRTLKRQVEEEVLHNKELEYRIEDLENETVLLQERLRNREDEYNSLVSLDQDYKDEREQMEQQIAHLFTYIEEHNARQQVSERQLREAQSEWEKLNEEHRNAQREVVELTAKLEEAMKKIRTQGVDNNMLKDRLMEARKQDELLAKLHNQLTVKQRCSDDASRRLGLADRMRQHVASEVNMHNHHSDLVKRKVLRRNPEVLQKMSMRRVDPSQYVRGSATQSLSLNNRIHCVNQEVSHELRLCGSSPIPISETWRTLNASSSSHTTQNTGSRRRRMGSQYSSHSGGRRQLGLRGNTAVSEAPAFIIDKTRRRNS